MAASAFRSALDQRNPKAAGERAWVFVPYDQLTDRVGPLATTPPQELGIVLVECPTKAARRPYHKQKLALVLANLRQFALEQAKRGVRVEHRIAGEGDGYAPTLAAFARTHGPLLCMRPAERELRAELAPLVDAGSLQMIDNALWLTQTSHFEASQKAEPPWRMDAFYRTVRRDSGILMDPAGKPVGGRFSFDGDNREAWHGEPAAATPPTFRHDAITREVRDLVHARYADHPGEVDLRTLPATARHASTVWDWAKTACMPCFGPYEDAMSTASTTLFHTRVSSLVNLGRLPPSTLIDDVLALDIELRCAEGFVRQLLGWREFVRHVHEATDGFQNLSGGGGDPSFLCSRETLPQAFWTGGSGMHCLDHVVETVWREAYSHHITRLMVLSNLATLMDVSPRELTDWFWVAYTDAYDWVVEPNVLGMGTYALGPLMTTKPYVSGAGYIDRMSDYCGACAFHPKKTCPVTRLYWAFLDRHRDALEDNQRLRMPYATLRKRKPTDVERDRATFAWVRDTLGRGAELVPTDAP